MTDPASHQTGETDRDNKQQKEDADNSSVANAVANTPNQARAVQSTMAGQNGHSIVQPSEQIRDEVREKSAQEATTPPQPSKPLGVEVPEIFKQPSEPQLQSSSPADSAVVATNQPPSGRWQAFWFAISALTLWMITATTSLATRQGTLRKMLIGVTDKAHTELFGTQIDILIAQVGLAIMLVAVPVFIASTIFVDRYRSAHPDLDTTGMKKIAYFFMVLAVLSIIGSLSTEIYLLISNNMYKENILTVVAPIAEIFFAGAYIYWLYTTVSEDRTS